MDELLMEINMLKAVKATMELAYRAGELLELGVHFAEAGDPIVQSLIHTASEEILEEMAELVDELRDLLNELDYSDPMVQYRLELESTKMAKRIGLSSYLSAIQPICELGGIL